MSSIKPEYAHCKKYRFKIVDEYGWDLSKDKARDMENLFFIRRYK